MARYKQNYTDLFTEAATATYTVDLVETKTVKGASNSYFRPGMSLTTTSGKIKIEADTLNETITNTDIEYDGTKSTIGWGSTKSFNGGNLNAYGIFILTCGNTNSYAPIVTSNGKKVWRNKNVLQAVLTLVDVEWKLKERRNNANSKKNRIVTKYKHVLSVLDAKTKWI